MKTKVDERLSFSIFHDIHLDLPKGAKWLLKDVNLTSLRV